MLKRWESGICHTDKIYGKSGSRVGGIKTCEIGFHAVEGALNMLHIKNSKTHGSAGNGDRYSHKSDVSCKIAMSSLCK